MAKSPLDTSLTILMPLKDRAQYTARILGYYNALQCPFKFLIADGGSHQELRKILREGTETGALGQLAKRQGCKRLLARCIKAASITKAPGPQHGSYKGSPQRHCAARKHATA